MKTAAAFLVAVMMAGSVPAHHHGSETSLYKRLGGHKAITAIVDDLLDRLPSDPKRVRKLFVDRLCAATGGPCVYKGGISEADGKAAAEHLEAALDKLEVPAREQSEVLAAWKRSNLK